MQTTLNQQTVIVMETKTINLDDHRHEDVKVFSGRSRGEAVRESTRLDQFDDNEAYDILIIAPPDTWTLTSSFFLGMFGPSVRKLGREGFLNRFKFEGPIPKEVIDDGIEEALKRKSPLGL